MSNDTLIETLEQAVTAVVPDGSPRNWLKAPAWTESDEGQVLVR